MKQTRSPHVGTRAALASAAAPDLQQQAGAADNDLEGGESPSTSSAGPHILTVGSSSRLVRNLWDRIAARGGLRIAHLVHPTYDRASWDESVTSNRVYFVREDMRISMPTPDRQLLESLERGDVPSIHNMIMSDRVVSKLPYEDALAYATLLTRRFSTLFRQIDPAVIIGGFDALHGSLALAVARQIGIPWYALSFSTIPIGEVSFCANLCPASVVVLEPHRREALKGRARELLRDFEEGRMRAPAYMPPNLLKPSVILGQLPTHLRSVLHVASRRRAAPYRRYTDYRNSYSFDGLVREALRLRGNLWQLRGRALLEHPPDGPYALFGLHMQPESTIDVFAHFFSNQLHVIELMSRSLPPTHSLLVKLHKSDLPNYSGDFIARLRRFPGVRVVAAQADSLEFIRKAALVFAIQGTMGLEAALLGKPVIMFGDSPVRAFPSVSTIGKTIDLPELVRAKLAEPPPDHAAIVEALATFLTPFYPASYNDWHIAPTDAEIEGYVRLFRLLLERLAASTKLEAAHMMTRT